MRLRALAGLVSLLAAAVAVGLTAPSAAALNVVDVTTTTDGGAGSLRAALDTAATDADDTEVVLQAGATYSLTVCGVTDEDANASGDLDIAATMVTESLTITGNGATIDGTGAVRVFEVDGPGGNLWLNNVRITGGSADNGGGIANLGGTVTLNFSAVTRNTAADAGGSLAVETGPRGGTVVRVTLPLAPEE